MIDSATIESATFDAPPPPPPPEPPPLAFGTFDAFSLLTAARLRLRDFFAAAAVVDGGGDVIGAMITVTSSSR